jgi:hypothetical protein
VSAAKLQRYAAFTLAYSVLLVLLVVRILPEALGLVLALVFALPLLWAWGAYQAHLELNDAVDDGERQLWRVGFYLVPPAMAAYWWMYVRGAGAQE